MNKKYTNKEVLEKADNEGLDYAILHWRIESKDIEDQELAKLWEDAYQALKKVDEFLDLVSLEDDTQ